MMKQERFHHILLITLSNIGDVVLTTPVLMHLRRYDPAARLTVLAGPKAAPLLKGSRELDQLITYDKKVSWLKKAELIARLREHRYSLVVDLRNTAIPFFLHARRRSPLFRNFTKTLMRERHLEVLRMTGLPCRSEAAGFDFFSDEEKKTAFEAVNQAGLDAGNVFVIAAGAASASKRWPVEHYAEVIRGLLQERPEGIALIGDKSERGDVDALCKIDPVRVMNFAGSLSLRQSAALIAGSKLLVSNDSAAMHLGHELGKRVVAVFGPTDPAKYGREGKTFRVIKPVKILAEKDIAAGSDAFNGVTPQRVLDACFELLAISGRERDSV